jgi:hypothetical protein
MYISPLKFALNYIKSCNYICVEKLFPFKEPEKHWKYYLDFTKFPV